MHDAIIAEVESLKGLVDEFAQFARMPAPRAVPPSLNAVLSTKRSRSTTVCSSHIQIERRFAPALPPVRLDAEQIRQVIINLVDNAIEALGDAGGRRPGGDQPHRETTRTTRPTRVVRLVITDNGPGVPAADRDKLFMPYYSTKGRGSGLGLAIVRRIVVEHGGVDRGRRQQAVKGRASSIELPGLMSSILIVDDEAGVRSALSGVLRDEGYGVDAVETGEACLDHVAARAATTSILLDIWLPGIDGLATLEKLRERRVDAQVIMISGHGNIESAVRATKLGAFDFIEKPLSLDKTVLAVATRCASGGSRSRTASCARPSIGGTRSSARAPCCASCASRSRWRRRPTGGC